MKKMYTQDYFNAEIFHTDYSNIAITIRNKYQPKRIIEFGCGPGHLTIALAKLGINVTAIDGFSNPDFRNYGKIEFFKVDLNSFTEIESFLSSNTEFELAICTEVAEHLLPESSAHLIKFLTQSAPIVIFSAAVPNQNGHGHINCQNRLFWHQLFKLNNFILVDSIRKEFQHNNKLAIWYKLNILDYVSKDINELNLVSLNNTIENLLFNESNASSLFYETSNILNIKTTYLNYFGIKQYMMIRNFLKNLIKT
jgi:SAM-dependent methyltransferase